MSQRPYLLPLSKEEVETLSYAASVMNDRVRDDYLNGDLSEEDYTEARAFYEGLKGRLRTLPRS